MNLLVLGDLHLGEEGFAGRPRRSWERFDAALTVGDIAHARVTVTDGTPQRDELVGLEEGRAFLQQLDELGVPILTVPGNHDFHRHATLLEGTRQARDCHRATSELDGFRAFGFGSETFDDGPELRYDPEAVTGLDDPDAWLERALDRAFHDETDAVVEELRERFPAFETQFSTYASRYETLASLATANENGTETIAIAHVPPFDTSLDRLEESIPQIGGRHWGSIALKNLLTTHDISFLACGHVHEGEGTTTVAGTRCLNAGYRHAYEVRLEEGSVSITEAEPPIE